MKDMTTLLGKYFTSSKTGAVCAITAVDEENRRVTANIDGELKELALGTLTGGWRKASDEEIETAALTAVEIPATNNGGSGPSYEAEPIPARSVEPKAQDAPEQTPELHGEPEPTETANNEPETQEPTTDDQGKPQQTMQMSDVVTKLENLFDLLNKAYFEGKLERPVITVQSTPKAYGHCSTKKIWQADGNGMYEINIGAEFLNRSSEQTAATMCHEMVHVHEQLCLRGNYFGLCHRLLNRICSCLADGRHYLVKNPTFKSFSTGKAGACSESVNITNVDKVHLLISFCCKGVAFNDTLTIASNSISGIAVSESSCNIVTAK